MVRDAAQALDATVAVSPMLTDVVDNIIDTSAASCNGNQREITWGQTGPPGPKGDQGPPGPKGDAAAAYEAFNPDFIHLTGTDYNSANSIATLSDLPAGAYAITVSVLGNAQGGSGRIVCLTVAGDRGKYAVSTIGGEIDQVMLATSFTAVIDNDGGQANMSCWLENGPGSGTPFVADADIVAIKVGARTRTQVSS